MRKFIFALGILAMTGSLQAQSLKDLKKKIPGQETNQSSSSSSASPAATTASTATAGARQYEMIEVFAASASSFHFSRCASGVSFGVGSTMMAGGEPVKKEDFFIDVKRNEQNQITQFKFSRPAGIEGGVYTPNEAAYPICYKGDNGYLYFIGEYAFFVRDFCATPEDVNNNFKNYCSGVSIFYKDAKQLKTIDSAAFKTMMRDYLREAQKGVAGVRAAEKDASDKAEADKRAKFTTKDRGITKLRIESSSLKLEQGKTYTFSIIASLKDGSEISTGKGGYADEYEISWTGLPATVNSMFGSVRPVGGSTITVPMDEVVQGDKITITVKSKFYPSMTATKEFVMDYSSPVDANYNADINSNSGSTRTIAGDLRVELKAVKHAVTGESLLEYKIFNSQGKTLMHFRVNETTSVTVQTCGQRGWSADSKHPAQDGLDGGNITIVIDPSVKSYNLTTKNTGGTGGRGNSNYPGNGANGRPGRVEKLNQKVSF